MIQESSKPPRSAQCYSSTNFPYFLPSPTLALVALVASPATFISFVAQMRAFLSFITLVLAFTRGVKTVEGLAITSSPVVTTSPPLVPRQGRNNDFGTVLSTCGFLNGDPSSPLMPGEDYDCKIDTTQGIWGFCPTTVRAAGDCGLVGFCYDAGPCSKGCGDSNLRDNPLVRTWTW